MQALMRQGVRGLQEFDEDEDFDMNDDDDHDHEHTDTTFGSGDKSGAKGEQDFFGKGEEEQIEGDASEEDEVSTYRHDSSSSYHA